MAELKKFEVIDVVEFSEDLMFVLYHLTENNRLRVWMNRTNDTYCYQLCVDSGDDVDIIELSGKFVNDKPTEAMFEYYLMKYEEEN